MADTQNFSPLALGQSANVNSSRLLDDGGFARSGRSLRRNAGSFKALALGGSHTCGITTAGRAVCTGDDTWGQAQNQPGPFQGSW
jgi:hypothetical protein